MVNPARLELATSCSGGKRSIQLSYGFAWKLSKYTLFFDKVKFGSEKIG